MELYFGIDFLSLRVCRVITSHTIACMLGQGHNGSKVLLEFSCDAKIYMN